MPNSAGLKNFEVCKGLDNGQLTAVQACCQSVKYQHGDRLFAKGENATHLWMLIQGSVELHFDLPGKTALGKDIISTISRGMSFGWSSLVPPNIHRLSAYVASDGCTLFKAERQALLDLFEKDAVLGYKVISNLSSVIARRFHQLQDKLAKQRGDQVLSNW